jgi:hypothetical protein
VDWILRSIDDVSFPIDSVLRLLASRNFEKGGRDRHVLKKYLESRATWIKCWKKWVAEEVMNNTTRSRNQSFNSSLSDGDPSVPRLAYRFSWVY